jgi:hypothetical protein
MKWLGTGEQRRQRGRNGRYASDSWLSLSVIHQARFPAKLQCKLVACLKLPNGKHEVAGNRMVNLIRAIGLELFGGENRFDFLAGVKCTDRSGQKDGLRLSAVCDGHGSKPRYIVTQGGSSNAWNDSSQCVFISTHCGLQSDFPK